MNANTTNTPGFVAITDALGGGVAGAIVWWRLSGDVNHDSLHTAWTADGRDPARLLAAPTPAAALRRAMMEVAGPRILVRPLPRRGGFALVEERAVGGKVLEHVTLLTTAIKDGQFTGAVNGKLDDATRGRARGMGAQIRAAYLHAYTHHEPAAVGAWLSRTVTVALSGVALRDTGGVYFVPADQVNSYRDLAGLLRGVSAHTLFEVPAMRTDAAVEAILGALRDDAARAANMVEETLGRADVGTRAIATQIAALDALTAKVTRYESLLGIALPELHARCTDLTAMATAARLLAMDSTVAA